MQYANLLKLFHIQTSSVFLAYFTWKFSFLEVTLGQGGYLLVSVIVLLPVHLCLNLIELLKLNLCYICLLCTFFMKIFLGGTFCLSFSKYCSSLLKPISHPAFLSGNRTCMFLLFDL